MTKGNGNLRGFGALAGVLVLAVLGAATALGGDKLKTGSETVDVGSRDPGSATAKCKPGTKAVSGGFETPATTGKGTASIDIAQSSRAGGRKWTSAGTNSSFLETAELTSYAYCRDEKVKSRKVTQSIPPTLQPETVTAKCKKGTKAISGGFKTEPPVYEMVTPIINVRISRKVGARRWQVTAANFGSVAGDLTVQVNCREGKGLKTQARTATVEELGETALDVDCKRKQRVVSGGFAHPTPNFGARTSKRDGKRGWHLLAHASDELTVYAYCEPKG
jgi:hypothetical protein